MEKSLQRIQELDKSRAMLGVVRRIGLRKSVVPTPLDQDRAAETSRDVVLQFNPLVFVISTRGPIVGADLY
jgi:hypothetical protein